MKSQKMGKSSIFNLHTTDTDMEILLLDMQFGGSTQNWVDVILISSCGSLGFQLLRFD